MDKFLRSALSYISFIIESHRLQLNVPAPAYLRLANDYAVLGQGVFWMVDEVANFEGRDFVVGLSMCLY